MSVWSLTKGWVITSHHDMTPQLFRHQTHVWTCLTNCTIYVIKGHQFGLCVFYKISCIQAVLGEKKKKGGNCLSSTTYNEWLFSQTAPLTALQLKMFEWQCRSLCPGNNGSNTVMSWYTYPPLKAMCEGKTRYTSALSTIMMVYLTAYGITCWRYTRLPYWKKPQKPTIWHKSNEILVLMMLLCITSLS